MNILILWWESISNKEFVEGLSLYLTEKWFNSTPIYYDHWNIEDWRLNISHEIDHVVNLIKNKDINLVIAKSMWCVISHTLLELWYLKESRFILLWLPLNLEQLSTMSWGNFGRQCIIIQNEYDRVWSFNEIKENFWDKVIKTINVPWNNTHKYENFDLIYSAIMDSMI